MTSHSPKQHHKKPLHDRGCLFLRKQVCIDLLLTKSKKEGERYFRRDLTCERVFKVTPRMTLSSIAHKFASYHISTTQPKIDLSSTANRDYNRLQLHASLLRFSCIHFARSFMHHIHLYLIYATHYAHHGLSILLFCLSCAVQSESHTIKLVTSSSFLGIEMSPARSLLCRAAHKSSKCARSWLSSSRLLPTISSAPL